MEWKEFFWPSKIKVILAFILVVVIAGVFFTRFQGISVIIAIVPLLVVSLIWSLEGVLPYPVYYILVIFVYIVTYPLWAYLLSCIFLSLWGYAKKLLGKKYHKLLWVVLLVVLFLIYASFTGLPVPARFEGHGCSVDYNVMLVPDFLCQLSTGGHCPSNYLITNNAEADFAGCLCNKYNESPSQEIEETIDELCSGNRFCMRECKENRQLSVNEICQEENRCLLHLWLY